MSLFLCTANGDFAIINNQHWLTASAPASILQANNGGVAISAVQQDILQLVRDHLRTFAQEVPLDQAVGVPYIQQLFLKGVQSSTIQAILQQQILAVPGVTGILNFALSVNRSTRVATVTFTVSTSAGPITITQSFP